VDIDGGSRIVGGIVDQGVDEFGVIPFPSAPRDLTAIRLHKMAMVSWSPPTSDRGSRILPYTLTVSDGRRVTVDASITSVTFDEIKKETCYTFMWLRATPRARETRLGDASRQLIAIDAPAGWRGVSLTPNGRAAHAPFGRRRACRRCE
jgi:hypothetical protein